MGVRGVRRMMTQCSRSAWMRRSDMRTRIAISILHGLRIECNRRVTYSSSRNAIILSQVDYSLGSLNHHICWFLQPYL